jgi:hypothetical protein
VLERFLARAVQRPPSRATLTLMRLICETAQTLIENGWWSMAEMSQTSQPEGV